MIGTPLSPGHANALLLLLDEPLSFWGGSDFDALPRTGDVTVTSSQESAEVLIEDP